MLYLLSTVATARTAAYYAGCTIRCHENAQDCTSRNMKELTVDPEILFPEQSTSLLYIPTKQAVALTVQSSSSQCPL